MEKKALRVALMVALLATSFLELQARVDLFTGLTFGGDGWEEPCCNKCGTVCTRSLPPICPCTYVRPYCPSECKGNCICNRKMPPTCTCTVMKWNCTVCPIPRIE